MALNSYRADSYLVLAGGGLGVAPREWANFPSLHPTVFRKYCGAQPGGNLCLPGKLREAGKEKINSGCLGFLARPE